MKEVNVKDIEIVEQKKVIDPVKNDNSEEDASVLVDANKKFLRQQRDDLLSSIESNISYRKNVGCHGTSILCLNLFLIGLYLYGFQQYGGFTCGMTNCPGTSFFFVFCLLNTLLFLYLIIRWKKLVKNRITDLKEEERILMIIIMIIITVKSSKIRKKKVMNLIKKIKKRYRK